MALVAFGNPLLDFIVPIQDNKLLKKYNLRNDDQHEVSADEMKKLMRDIAGHPQFVTPGGCAQNTLRVYQWMLGSKCTATMFGAVGQDEQSKTMQELLEKDGVQTKYLEHEHWATGNSVCLTQGQQRTLVAHLGAAEKIKLSDFSSNHDLIPALEAANVVYMEGFFLAKRVDVAKFIMTVCRKYNKTFAFNISAAYMCDAEPVAMVNMCQEADILFGNSQEYEKLCATMDKRLVDFFDYMFKFRAGTSKIIIVTNGSSSVTCAYNDKIEEFKVPSVDASQIVDTTGAGDAFVGGFLAGHVLKRMPLNCCELGCYAAQEIIKTKGCTLPDHPPVVLL